MQKIFTDIFHNCKCFLKSCFGEIAGRIRSSFEPQCPVNFSFPSVMGTSLLDEGLHFITWQVQTLVNFWASTKFQNIFENYLSWQKKNYWYKFKYYLGYINIIPSTSKDFTSGKKIRSVNKGKLQDLPPSKDKPSGTSPSIKTNRQALTSLSKHPGFNLSTLSF